MKIRFRNWTVIFLILSVILLFPAAVFCQGPELSVSGTATNGSPDGEVPIGALATIQFFTEDEWGNSYETTIQQDGSFIFTNLSAEAGNSYVIYLEYLHVVYTSPQSILDENSQTGIEITVYETTESADDIQINEVYFLIYPEPDRIQITEVYQIMNRGVYAYTGSKSNAEYPITFTWSPPDGAQSVKMSEPGLGQRFFQAGNLYYDTYPIRPQPYIHEVVFSYEFPTTDRLLITKQLEFPVKSIYIAGNTERFDVAENSNFQKTQMQTNDVGLVNVYLGGPYSAGEKFSFAIVQQQVSPEEPGTGVIFNTEASSLIMGISALIIAIMISIALVKKQELLSCPEKIRPEIQKIIALENQLQGKEISKTDFEHQRNSLISKIIDQLDDDNI